MARNARVKYLDFSNGAGLVPPLPATLTVGVPVNLGSVTVKGANSNDREVVTATINHVMDLGGTATAGDYQISFQLSRKVGSGATVPVYTTTDGGSNATGVAAIPPVDPKGTTTTFVYAETGLSGSSITYSLTATLTAAAATGGTIAVSIVSPVFLVGTLYDENED
ncbi:hypothetical protein ACFQZT_08955 [Paenibacillus sp. GCM10027628]|uniref:hypothetical protein n=1 Tax=Paenibacillus sp. GCM10027628 TaxID=3273413 RepID=UPI003633547B